MTESKYDFQDCLGEVPAKRHTNPDQSVGGWVAATAKVEPTAYVGPNARVTGSAVVTGYALVTGSARVDGSALVYGSARVTGSALVTGSARVGGSARVDGSARVTGSARVDGDAQVYGYARVDGEAVVSEGCHTGKPNPQATEGVKCRNVDCANSRVFGQYFCAPCGKWPTSEIVAVTAERGPGPSLAGNAQARKAAPMFEGLVGYFPNALACVSNVSKVGNEQHNPGQPMQWSFDKSTDEKDCLLRHLAEAGTLDTDGLRHSAKVAWRALANLERELLASDPALKQGVNVKGFVRK